MIVTFCGHAQISQSEKIEKWLYAVTQKLIEQGATTFYLGGYGAFMYQKCRLFGCQCANEGEDCPSNSSEENGVFLAM